MESINKKVQKVPKQTAKRYVVKVNNQPVFTSETRKEAFTYISNIKINESIQEVTVVRETVMEYSLRSFKPVVSTTLIASDLGPEVE